MRIIAGKYKNKKINFVFEKQTRPTADMVRQALFTKLQFEFPMENCLDLFAGSGSLGLEALSRGAEHVYFVDNNRANIKIVESNLKNFNLNYETNVYLTNKNASLIFGDYSVALKKFDIKFDLILIDPPYASSFYETALNIIKEKDLLKDNGYIVLEHDENRIFKDLPYEIISQKKYGRKCLTYLQKALV